MSFLGCWNFAISRSRKILAEIHAKTVCILSMLVSVSLGDDLQCLLEFEL